MKKKDLTELRAKTVEEIRRAATDAQAELEKMKLEGVQGRELNRVAIKNKKREVAQMLTVLTEKKGLNA